MSARIYGLDDLRERGIPYSDVHLGRLEHAGKFPKRIKLNPGSGKQGRKGWNADEIDQHIADLLGKVEKTVAYKLVNAV